MSSTVTELYTSKNDELYLVTELPENPLLVSLGVFKGAKIFKKTTYGGGGPALLVINSREVAVGKDLAIKILVEKI